MFIDGKLLAEQLLVGLKERLSAHSDTGYFGAVLVGEDSASVKFLSQKKKVAKELGLEFRLYQYPTQITTDKLREEIGKLAAARSCGAFIVQLPLPESINRHYVLNAIPKWKDVDLLGESALGAFYTGRHPIVPPSVATAKEFLKDEGDLREKTVAVIGAGLLIGRPIGFWLQSLVGELMVFDKSVKNLQSRLGSADIVISGAGEPHLFSTDSLKTGTLVIDFGYGRKEFGEMCGDFNPAGAVEKNIRYTKTPRGTGPVLVVKLFENFYKLSEANSSGKNI